MSALSAKARRLLAALGDEPLTRDEWMTAAKLRGYRNREIAELIRAGYVKKLSTPEGNFFVRLLREGGSR